jgi:hypothetical protein
VTSTLETLLLLVTLFFPGQVHDVRSGAHRLSPVYDVQLGWVDTLGSSSCSTDTDLARLLLAGACAWSLGRLLEVRDIGITHCENAAHIHIPHTILPNSKFSQRPRLSPTGIVLLTLAKVDLLYGTHTPSRLARNTYNPYTTCLQLVQLRLSNMRGRKLKYAHRTWRSLVSTQWYPYFPTFDKNPLFQMTYVTRLVRVSASNVISLVVGHVVEFSTFMWLSMVITIFPFLGTL